MLRVVSLLADCARPFVQGVVDALAERTGVPMTRVAEGNWRDWGDRLYAGDVDLGFLCGLLYVRQADHLSLLGAPVMAAPRYGGQAVYFTDVVVRAESPYTSWADLQGCRWAYNTGDSYSGYVTVAAHLAGQGQTSAFFGSQCESGAHQTSLTWLQQGRIDAVPIDSTVLDMIAPTGLRVVATLGPNPMPPFVASRRLDSDLAVRIRDALLHLHEDAVGRAVLALGQAASFADVHDADYNPIRVADGVAAHLSS
jgi:phosphonate transport system substrate-binding protein